MDDLTIDEKNRDFKFGFTKSSKNVSVKDFTSLYMKTREFVFKKSYLLINLKH